MIIKAFKAFIVDGKQGETEAFFAERKEIVRHAFFDTHKIMNVNVFIFQNELYCYIESIDCEIFPEQLFAGAEQFLQAWPGEKNQYYQPMINIFHCNEPQSVSHWTRNKKPDYCFAMIAKLIPDAIARYIFYHYQFQEEQPGAGDKYGRIFLSGETALYYGEIPEMEEKAEHMGSLSTHNTPEEPEWQNLMGSHFVWWDESYPVCDIKTYDWDKSGYPTGQCNHQWLYLKNIFSIC